MRSPGPRAGCGVGTPRQDGAPQSKPGVTAGLGDAQPGSSPPGHPTTEWPQSPEGKPRQRGAAAPPCWLGQGWWLPAAPTRVAGRSQAPGRTGCACRARPQRGCCGCGAGCWARPLAAVTQAQDGLGPSLVHGGDMGVTAAITVTAPTGCHVPANTSRVLKGKLRQQGRAPGLHALPRPYTSPGPEPAGPCSRPWRGTAVNTCQSKQWY